MHNTDDRSVINAEAGLETLSGLEIFVETAQSQSFVATGRKMGISASAVSKSISRLEERVGVRLFQRSTRTVRLTSEGEVFLERCRRILTEIQAAEDDQWACWSTPVCVEKGYPTRSFILLNHLDQALHFKAIMRPPHVE